MARHLFSKLFALTALAASGAAFACASEGCETGYSLLSPGQSCAGRAMLAPGNDSRLNLMFLLADRGGRSMAGLSYPGEDYDFNQLGRVYLDWRMLRGALYHTKLPDYSDSGPAYTGTRCQSYSAGSNALSQAMAANRALPEAERTAIAKARGDAEAVCKAASSYEYRNGNSPSSTLPAFSQWPAVASPAGREFLGYVQAANAFYGERWDQARSGFAALGRASDPFVREAAAYMLIRTEFAAAQAPAFGDYGSYDGASKVDQAAAKRGFEALTAYLKGWPRGRYVTSAQGLLRRGLWLTGYYSALGKTYADMLGSVSPQQEAAADLVEEVDTKLLFNPDAKDAAQGALLLAAQDLVAMRDQNFGEGAAKPAITAAALDAQAPAFAGQAELFGYLQATHAYYFAHDYRRVLQLIPDQAKQAGVSNLAFSRQMLRGMALAALKDRNEAGFWQDVIGAAKGAWQRPLAELGLALSWERSGRIDAVFAPGSPITEPALRQELLTRSAGPALLRTVAQQAASDGKERDSALYTLLAGELSHGQFAAFLSDAAIPVWNSKDATAGIFTKGKTGDGAYPCAPLTTSVRALAANPGDAPARLCLGEFFRIYGIGDTGTPYFGPSKDELGGFARGFPGKQLARADFYTAVIANPAARGDDKAYALYRAVMCYAPSGISECGPEVPKSQRKAWYDQLKRDYPQSAWAKKLRYYW